MRADGMRYVVYCAALLGALFVFQGFVSVVHAADVKEMLKQVDRELRQAERDMFGGKAEQVVASLEEIKEKLLRVKEADPNNPQVKSCEKKFEKLVKDLERRTGKDLGGGSLTAAGASKKPELPPKPGSKPILKEESQAAQPTAEAQIKTEGGTQLPNAARRPTQNAEKDLERIDSAIQRLSDPKSNPDQLLGNMEKYLESARKNLETGRAEAAKKGVTSHPDFDALDSGIAEAEKKIAEAGKMHEVSKKEASAKAGEVTVDVKALKAEYDRVLPVFQNAAGGAIYYNDLKPVEELIVQIENFEKIDLNKIIQQMEAFGKKYGTTRDEIDQKADAMGYMDSYYRASFAYTELAQGIENIKKTRAAMADDLIRRAEDMKERTAKGIHDFARTGQHTRIKNWGQMAARFDSDNPKVKEFNDKIDAWVRADAKALNDKIDKATFPKQAVDAPKNAAELIRAAIEFLQKEEDNLAAEKGKEVNKILTVVVTDPWRVFKKNILGEPIQYNLPIATAVQTESEKAQNLARAYLSTLLTQEMKGVKMGPPYIGVTVGESYYIRPSAVK